MAFLQWEEQLDVHVDGMNQEHTELIRLMNKVHDASSAGAGHALVARAVDELVKYTQKHFRDEEAYMASIGFGGLKSHQLIHRDLLSRVGGFAQEFKAARAERLPDDFFRFLRVWLVSHIQAVDTKYGVAGASAPQRLAR
jgi:hemerythrin-like metal-binding protein